MTTMGAGDGPAPAPPGKTGIMNKKTFWGMHVRTPVSTNWPATFAAISARGPRCDHCGNWTFRPQYLTEPKRVPRRCPDCLPKNWFSLIIGVM